MLITLSILLFISTSANAALAYWIYRKHKNPPKTHSVELQEFLTDLFSTGAILAMGRVDPTKLMLRSPRGG